MSRDTDASERRRRAPVLNKELEHASSLTLRALRTEHTRDLTAQLIKYLRHEETTIAANGRQSRDQWTRWPLPDALESEWDLEDEIGVIVRRKLGHCGVSGNCLVDEHDDHIDQLVQHLTPILTQFLESILVIVEEHTVLRPQSLQDRINPLNWSNLANILASPAMKELVDGRLLGQYVYRMESILGASQPNVRRGWALVTRKILPSDAIQAAIERCDMFDRQRAERQNLYSRLLASLF